jgi:hypothetical protein
MDAVPVEDRLAAEASEVASGLEVDIGTGTDFGLLLLTTE